jgi:GDP-L-fucose synthase
MLINEEEKWCQISMMIKDSKIYVAGQRGLIGSAIVRMLNPNGYNNIVVLLAKN